MALDIWSAARECRRLQQRYYALEWGHPEKQKALGAAKRAEGVLDKMIKEYDEGRQSGGLFEKEEVQS